MEELYLIWYQEYETVSIRSLITKDKLDEYIEWYKKDIMERNFHDVNFQGNIEVIKKDACVDFKWLLSDEWIWDNYHNLDKSGYYKDLTLEEMKAKKFGQRDDYFEYTPLKVNEFK